ncbi:hypothetical protein JJC03_00330 [Flavobacterium oreochromis]|uniref:hypothetical protein n=1 Tax=Flavobacterium oreochromis TaxID=2906078 RepID=UPI001CE519EE|nr:hypothetical protein [Flavobacterium oreochromis]QYS86572.1 hypothetical protein JJC03_00330 [Flavobacterium oreochromis]
MAFQFIRFQKFLLILLEISLGFLLIELIQRMKLKSYYSIIIVFIFLFLLVFSHTSLISRLPLIGDDLGKSILPKIFMVNAEYRNSNKSDLNTIIEYIKRILLKTN